MPGTLVIQSQRSPLPYRWMESCLHSVREWCAKNGYEYRFMGDELFDLLPESLREKTRCRTVIASDLARLLALQGALNTGYQRLVWMDSDFLVFNPSEFALPGQPYALGREVWVQHDRNGRLKS